MPQFVSYNSFMNNLNAHFVKFCKLFHVTPDIKKLNIHDFSIALKDENSNMDFTNFKSVNLSFEEIPNADAFIRLRNDFLRHQNNPYFVLVEIDDEKYTKQIFVPYFNYFFSYFKDKLTGNELLILEKQLDNLWDISLNGIITFTFREKQIWTIFNKIQHNLVEMINKIGFKKIQFEIKIIENHDSALLEKSRDNAFKNGNLIIVEEQPEVKQFTYSNQYGRSKSSQLETLKQVTQNFNSNTAYFIAEVYKLEEKISKNNNVFFVIKATDYTDAIQILCFTKTEEQVQEFRNIKVGKTYEFKGGKKFDDNFRSWTVMLNSFKEADPLQKIEKDIGEKTRIEFNVKTNMSTMDGIKSANDFVRATDEMGLSGLAILDNDGVQSFPNFFHSKTQNKSFKKIYGASFSTVSVENNVILNYKGIDGPLLDEEYVVFDLETTGLSPIVGEIIEFGGVLIKGEKVIERYQFFLKASQPLSNEITELTNITDFDLINGLEQEKGIRKIFDIVKNRRAVAHNANFDMSFLLENFQKYNLGDSNTLYFDTMALSRTLKPDTIAHNLKAISKHHGADYSKSDAHRADYDADVLVHVWISFLKKLNTLKITSLEKLHNYKPDKYTKQVRSRFVDVIAKNNKGLKELYSLITEGSTELLVQNENIENKIFANKIWEKKNVLIGSGTLHSNLYETLFFRSSIALKEEIAKYDYIEIVPPHGLIHMEDILTKTEIQYLVKLLITESIKQNKVVIAVSNARYIHESDMNIFEILVNTAGIKNAFHPLYNSKKARAGSLVIPKQFIPNTKQMKSYFSFLENEELVQKIVVDNTHLLASQIDDLEIIKNRLFTPVFDNSDENLKNLVYKNAYQKYGEILPKVISERIEKELTPIIKYGFAVIYWISQKLTKKSLDDGYIVGSRGSVGSSLVATLAGITEVNPLAPHYLCPKCKDFTIFENHKITSGYDLPDKKCSKCDIFYEKDGQSIPFETFLGFNADKVPDIDLNFSSEYQSKIHDYARELFGNHHTFRAGTIGTAAYKTAIGWVRGYLEKTEKTFSNSYVDFLATKLEGVKRTTGKHAGGVIIIPKEYDIEDFTPVVFPGNDYSSDWKTTHFDFHAIHDSILKLDLLGHDDPTAIKILERLSNVKISEIPKSDEKVISLFSSCKALGIPSGAVFGEKTGAIGIPEFGTPFVRRMLADVNVTKFADLISVSGLSHGTNVWINNAENLIKNLHIPLNDVVSCRDDIMLYLINAKLDPFLAFTIMERVRKNIPLTEEQVNTMKKHKIPEWYIDSLQKIQYMFPKAHATAYVIMAWRIAWYKLYKPLEYYAVYFTVRSKEFDIKTMISSKEKIEIAYNKLKELKSTTEKQKDLMSTYEVVYEMNLRGFKISNLDIKKSLTSEWIVDRETKSLIPPFNTIAGLAEKAGVKIVEERNKKHYSSMEDFKKRSGVNQTQFETLKKLKVFDKIAESEQIKLF